MMQMGKYKHKGKIAKCLLSLEDIDGVKVEFSEEYGSFTIREENQMSIDFYFKWAKDHWIGYFEDKDGDHSHAVISLWTPLDAVQFVTAYSLMLGLRARRPSPL